MLFFLTFTLKCVRPYFWLDRKMRKEVINLYLYLNSKADKNLQDLKKSRVKIRYLIMKLNLILNARSTYGYISKCQKINHLSLWRQPIVALWHLRNYYFIYFETGDFSHCSRRLRNFHNRHWCWSSALHPVLLVRITHKLTINYSLIY